MHQYSQNDNQWKNIKLGTSNTTIGSHGCTITALAGLLTSIDYEENPKTVNQKLTDNRGFLRGNLLIWSAINRIWPRAKFVWRGWSYTDDDNVKIKDAIQKYGACLVAVDGSSIGGGAKDGHWVTYIGNKQLIDPWDGLKKPSSTYKATGYSIIELLKNESEVEEDIHQDLQKTITNLNGLVAQKNSTISEKQGEIDSLKGQLKTATSRINSLTKQVKKIPGLEKENEHLLGQRATWIESEENFNRIIGQLRAENEKLRSRVFSTLLIATLERIKLYISQKFNKIK